MISLLKQSYAKLHVLFPGVCFRLFVTGFLPCPWPWPKPGYSGDNMKEICVHTLFFS